MTRTRFAPSPTGDLHLGGAYVAWLSWTMAKRSGGTLVLRVEDIDTPRVVSGSAERILEDLAWLGLDWDEGPFAQSERISQYAEAIDALTAQGLTYPCDCSRADIARVASAPHAGEETVYPGICRERDPGRPMKRAPALRVRVPDEEWAVDDGLAGRFSHRLASAVGDFVLRRGDGIYAYQLAVAVDDWQMGISDVVRGIDLLASTPRQIWLMNRLGAKTIPRYRHVPLVVDSNGQRLAKRTPGAQIRALRDAGISAEAIRDALEHAPASGFRIPEAWARASIS